jgi:hypothetical protein
VPEHFSDSWLRNGQAVILLGQWRGEDGESEKGRIGRLRPNSPEMTMPDLPEHGHASPRPHRTAASQKAEGLSRAGGHPAIPKSSTAVFAEISASAVIIPA